MLDCLPMDIGVLRNLNLLQQAQLREDSAPIRAESRPGSLHAQRMGQIQTIIISGKIKMKPGPCLVAWKRQPLLEGKEDSWKQPSQGCHMCAVF